MSITHTHVPEPAGAAPRPTSEHELLNAEMRRLRETLAELEMLCRATWEASPDLAFLATRRAGGSLRIRPADEHHVPRDPWGVRRPMPRDIAQVISKDAGLTNQISLALLHRTRFEQEWSLVLPEENETCWIRFTCVPCHANQALLVARNITRYKQIESSLESWQERYRRLTGELADYIFSVEVENGVAVSTSHTPACEAVTGYTPEEFHADRYLWINMVLPEHRESIRHQASEVLQGRSVLPVEHLIRRKDGEVRWVRNTSIPYFDQQGRLIAYDGLVQDIHEQKEAEQKLHASMEEIKSANTLLELQKSKLQEQQSELMRANEQMLALTQELTQSNNELSVLARTDPLTRLLNRRAWEETLQHEHARARRHGTPYSILMIDVDHFKLYNDSKGHQAGDRCLRRVAECIAHTCRAQDFVGRYGGEEFVVLATLTDDEQARGLAERVRDAVEGLMLDHPRNPVRPHVTVSIGVATHGHELWEATIHRADEALYQAKSSGRNRVVTAITPAGSSKAQA